MKLYESYKQSPELDDHYDVICIGSGLGSMTAASLLAREGKKVLVLEKHYTPGGFTHVFKRPEYEWDVGIHYIGEVTKKGTLLWLLFEELSEGKLEWEDMGDVYDRIVFGNETFDFVKGVSNFKQRLKEYFPEPDDQRAIDEYVDLLFQVSAAGRSFYAEKALPPAVSFLAAPLLRRKLARYYKKTTYEALREITDNEKLIAVLTGQYGDYGMPPRESSFAIHAVVAKHYLNGGAYPVGGAQEIFHTMAPAVIRSGGKFLVNAGVKKVWIERGKAKGVELADGRKISADITISGAGFITTLYHLLPEDIREKYPKSGLEKVQPSTSHICLYIGLKGDSEELRLPRANYWIYPDNYDHDENLRNFLNDPDNSPFPVVYISFPSAKDPKWKERYPGKSTIEIITVAPYDWFSEWEDARWKKRGEEYEALKARYANRLLEILYAKEPQLRGKVDYFELSTPLSTKHFCNYQTGEIYGLDHSPERYDQRFLRPHTPLKNFFLTGQDIVSAGIGGALIAGVLTASAILRKNLLEEIIRKKK